MSHSDNNNTVSEQYINAGQTIFNDFDFANHFTNDFDLKSVGKNDFDFKSF